MELLLREDVWLPAALLAAAALLGWGLASLGLALAARVARRAASKLGVWLAEQLGPPLRLLAPAVAVRLAQPLRPLPEPASGVLAHAALLVTILAVGWMLVALSGVFEALVRDRYSLDQRDNLRARRIQTRFRLLRRVLVIAIGVLTVAAMLLTFPAARALGTGLLASAGLAGLVVGMAARPTLESLLAGLQLALTEPINIDDVVIVEGEWGRIEEIRTTYVVVRIWDQRRLIVPTRYFLSQPFQNWTRVSAELLGAVTLQVDYRTPVDEVRAAAGRIVASSELWNREFWNLAVVDAGERSLTLRVLVSASDSSNAWDLRCEVREKLVAWLQREHPEALPRLRAEIGPPQPTGNPG